MTDEAAPKVSRTRAPRTVRPEADAGRERRKKPGATTHYGKKLHIDKEQMDPAYKYRWVNDTASRVRDLEAEDWDPVKRLAAAGGDTPGSVASKFVGSDAGGKPIKAVLMRKRKEWYDADQKEKRAPLDEMDKAIRGGTAHQQSNESDLATTAYTPGGVNILER